MDAHRRPRHDPGRGAAGGRTPLRSSSYATTPMRFAGINKIGPSRRGFTPERIGRDPRCLPHPLQTA
ncbi:MAG: hypothetical protein ACLUQ6_05800 [Alistipes onderdonkii]